MDEIYAEQKNCMPTLEACLVRLVDKIVYVKDVITIRANHGLQYIS